MKLKQTQRPRLEKKMKPLSPPLEPLSPGAFTTSVQWPSSSWFDLCCLGLIFVVSSLLFGFDLRFFVGLIFVVHGFCVYLNSVVGVEVEMGLFVSLWVSGFAWVC